MKNYIYIGKRQSGKTTIAIDEFMKDPENTLFIVNNQTGVNKLKERILEKYIVYGKREGFENIISVINGSRIDKKYDKIIIDEFFFLDNKIAKLLWETIMVMLTQEGSIYIFSSYNPSYRKYQERFVDNLALQGWKEIRLRGGKIEEENNSIFPFDNSI